MKSVLWFAALAGLTVQGRMLRRGITEISAGTVTSDGTYTAASIPLPLGNAAPQPLTTPSPYQTYSANFDTQFVMNWAPPSNAFVFDTTNINKLSVDLLGDNFRIIKTSSPVFPVPTA